MKNIISVNVALSSLSLALGYGLRSFWLGSGCIITLGLLWLVSQRLEWKGLPTLGFVLALGIAAFGMWQGLPAGWMLSGTVTALAAWDLAGFEQRLRQAPHLGNKTRLQWDHLRFVALVAGLGLLLGGAALSFQLNFGLGWAIGLGLLFFIGLGRVTGLVRADQD